MKARMYVLVVGGALVIYACGGGDNTGLDGGSDATNGGDANPPGDGGNKDGATTNDGSTNDGSTNDGSANDGSGGDAGTFACGTKTCSAATQYCEKTKVGPDGGPKIDGCTEIDNCLPLPTSCTADGGSPSCACIVGQCGCTQSGPDITVTCP